MSTSIKALVVDDERYSREELQHLLKVHPVIEVIGEADTGESALMQALQLTPDVVFLDVEMPRMNGLDAARSLRELKKVPHIVFTTAYPDFAVEAFRHNALDYILKPYEEDAIAETVRRITVAFGVQEASPESELIGARASVTPGAPGRLSIESDGEIIFLDPREILYLFRDEKRTKLVTTSGDYEAKAPLKEFEERLASFHFFRIHKGYLVNLDFVSRLSPWFNGAYQLELVGREEQLAVSRNYVKGLRAALSL
ncbi:response regulator transcription factor [Paenalkalicoccus suaedae]|uniref:Response regulator transcription factor n=1 Tax=Paenalkalicoccus suaedae TaxID=2592382 RepID=A0A859FIH1_9BACI|nr:LytTR family DNA-binding domain-containing protein [Paenalkalicoccus suaedae]QKS72658.1 response regulator transcription factor [Paenalkalicoccus suaedae]